MNQSKTGTMTPEEALLYLAGLEESCANCGGKGILGGEPDFVGEKTVVHAHYPCPPCKGTGQRPVLDLREKCPGRCGGTGIYRLELGKSYPGEQREDKYSGCGRCGGFESCALLKHIPPESRGRGWVPKQGEMALHQAMTKDGWSYSIKQIPPTSYGAQSRVVHFWKD